MRYYDRLANGRKRAWKPRSAPAMRQTRRGHAEPFLIQPYSAARSEYHQCNIARSAAGIRLGTYEATEGAKYVILINFLCEGYVHKFLVDFYSHKYILFMLN
jgi:hypothetical protein